MSLVIDIGNTTIHFGIFGKDKLIKNFKVETHCNASLQIIKLIKNNFKIHPNKIIICSVVPKETIRLKKNLKQIFKINPIIVGRDLVVPIKNLYLKPKQVGQDRLVNAYAGVAFYGSPLIVVDFGTAITFDIISKNKEYLGGMILPGLNMSLEALGQKTALLPKVKLTKPKEFIGRDTKQSILSGIVYGFSAMTDNLTERIKTKIGKNAKIIATGGNTDLVSKFSNNINVVDKNLTLKGLNLLAQLR
ncbi:MAG: type III pantothenate kinase [Candidatus Omnitrophota bacterium]